MEKSKAEESPLYKKGKKTGPNKNEGVSFCYEKKKNSPVKATDTGGAPRWCPDFEQRRFLLFMQAVPASIKNNHLES